MPSISRRLGLPDWQLDHSLAIFAAYATLLVETICLIFGRFVNPSPLIISLISNGYAVLLVGYCGRQAMPAAFLCIFFTSISLLYAIFTSNIVRETYGEEFSGKYSILVAVAHLSHTLISLYKQRNSQGDHVVSRELEKNEHLTMQSQTGKTSYSKSDVEEFDRDVVFEFGDAFRMRMKEFIGMVLGTSMIYRSFDFDGAVAIILSSFSGVLCALLLFIFDIMRCQGHDLSRLWGLIPMASFYYLLFEIVEPDLDVTWWRMAFPLFWFLWLLSTLNRHLKHMPRLFVHHPTWFRPTWSLGIGHIGPATTSRLPTISFERYIKVADPMPSPHGMRKRMVCCFRWQKGPDTVERHWLNGQPWIQMSPRIFVLLLASCSMLGYLSSSGSSEVPKTAGFYLVLAFTLASKGHSPVAESPEPMFVHLKHSLVGWKPVVGTLVITAMVHAALENPDTERINSAFGPVVCVLMVRLAMPIFSKAAETHEIEIRLDHDGSTVKTQDLESQVPMTPKRVQGIDSTLVYSSSSIRSLDLRILAMGLCISTFDIVMKDFSFDGSSISLVPGYTTAILMVLDTSVPSGHMINPIVMFVLTGALFARFKDFHPLKTIGFQGPYASDDDSEYVRALCLALFFTSVLIMIVNDRNHVRNQEKHRSPMQTSEKPVTCKVLINLDMLKLGANCRWQLHDSEISNVLLLLSISIANHEGGTLPLLGTTFATLVTYLVLVGFRIRPIRSDEDRISIVHLSAMVICMATSLIMAAVCHQKGNDSWTQWQSITWIPLAAYTLFSWSARLIMFILRAVHSAESVHLVEPESGDATAGQ